MTTETPSISDDAIEARDYLRDVMNNEGAKPADRLRAALALVQLETTRRKQGGIKEQRQERAEQLGAGKYAISAPPKLVRAK